MIELLPVKPQDFPDMVKQTIQGFADECVAAGRWTATVAYAHSKSLIENDLPEGLNTPGNLFFHLISTSGHENVGYVWLEIMTKDNLPTIFIADIEIKSNFRRRGFATSTFAAI